jgi:hypothetical protein
MLEETWRRMLRLKTSGWKMTGARGTGTRVVAEVLAVGLLMAGATQGWAQVTTSTSQTATTTTITTTKIGPAAPVTYDNKFDFYAGVNFMNFQAGQSLPKRMNLAGMEFSATYWLGGRLSRLGVVADYRGEAGTTPVFAAAGSYPYNFGRPLVYMNIGMAGAQWRGPKNQYVAVNYHAYGGVGHGTFDSTRHISGQPDFFGVTGLYTNRTKPIFALGGSIDFNRSKRWAIRVSPDLILEHFGTETREFVAVSGGVLYRWK